ncbi:hypothetical protein GCK72_008713 [Caenorhabditis remanei]|uniref:Uncharacterized protein n=1 Tax=Caenorhabditis remanei TaxID=31234 RepID=A0A6A5H112_CAERE|nr:hypothetical protein GCK72_008713 [Caenorhabditis remanei]KAF1760464.1 hypothetical protein GCK72_008713 [Caenorhabditis remanei]
MNRNSKRKLDYENGKRLSYLLFASLLGFMSFMKPQDFNFFFKVYVPVLQSSGVLPIALFGASNIINSGNYEWSHLLDVFCIILSGITVIIGCVIIVKMGTKSEFGCRRVLVTTILNNEVKRNIVKRALKYSLFCNTELSDSRNQDMVALILYFRSVEKCQKFVEGVTDIYTEQGLFAQKLEDSDGLKGLEVLQNVNPVQSCCSSNSFKNGYMKGEKLIISRVIETVLLRQVNAQKLVVRLFRWKIDWNLVFNAMVLLSSTASLFSTYVSTDFASKTLQHGYFFGIAYGIIGSVMGIFARLWKVQWNLQLSNFQNCIVIGYHVNEGVCSYTKKFLEDGALDPQYGVVADIHTEVL